MLSPSFVRSFALLSIVASTFACELPADPQGTSGSNYKSRPAPSGDPSTVLDLVNQTRSTARTCGDHGPFEAAPPLEWDDRLAQAGAVQAADMADHDFFSHTGSDGSQPADRISAQGYEWSYAGENIAAGQPTPEAVVKSWVESPGHCANIMNPSYVHMGVARATGGSYGVYWAQEFGKPAQ
jgi:uncharacterized protein YkwD